MRRSTAIKHLEEMGDAATELVERAGSLGVAPLTELWVTGELLTWADELDRGAVVMVLDLPPDELTWIAKTDRRVDRE